MLCSAYRPPVFVGGSDMDGAIRAIDAVMREVTLFAAAGLLVGGLDDLVVDILFLMRRVFGREVATRTVADLPTTDVPLRFAIFVAAWDEAAVIGQMLATAVAQLDYPDYRLFVGLYPNDPGSIDAAARVAERDSRISTVNQAIYRLFQMKIKKIDQEQ